MPTAETNGIETYYHDHGDGHPIVVAHGAGADHQIWTERLQPLTDDYRIITYDLRGHGKTGGSSLDNYSIDTYVDDLVALIETLNLEQPVVLGHSLGGMVGYVFASSYPEYLSGLVTVGARSPQAHTKLDWVISTVLMRLSVLFAERERLLGGFQQVIEAILSDDSTADMNEAEKLRQRHDCNPDSISSEEKAKAIRAAQRYLTSSRMLDFDETPVLMMYGENEPLIDSHAEFFESTFDSCRAVEVPEASHNAQVDKPEFIRDMIREFAETEAHSVEQTTR